MKKLFISFIAIFLSFALFGAELADKKANEPGRKVLTVPVGAGASKLLMKNNIKVPDVSELP